MARHFFTPERPTIAGAYWLRRKDKPAELVRVWSGPVGQKYVRKFRGRDFNLDCGKFEGDWLGPIEPKEGIPLGFLTAGMNCASRLDGCCWRPKNVAAICPADSIPDYCPLRGE